MIKEEKVCNLQMSDACFVGDYMYFSANNLNGLFRVDLNTDKAEFLTHFVGEEFIQDLHRKILYKDGKLIFIPYYGKGISVYDIQTNEISWTQLSDESLTFSTAFLYNDKILLIPLRDMYFFGYFEVKEKRFVRISEISEKLNSLKTNIFRKDVFCAIKGAFLCQDILYWCVFGTDSVLVIDLCTHIIEIKKLDGYRLDNIELIGDSIFITTKSKQLLKLSRDLEIEKVYTYESNNMLDIPFFVCEIDKKILMIPTFRREIYIYENQYDKWKVIENNYDNDEFYNMVNCWEIKKYRKNIYCISRMYGKTRIYNLDFSYEKQLEIVLCKKDKDYIEKVQKVMFDRQVSSGGLLMEGAFPNDRLDRFLEYI